MLLQLRIYTLCFLSLVHAKTFLYINDPRSYSQAETYCRTVFSGLLFGFKYATDPQRDIVLRCVPPATLFWVEFDIRTGYRVCRIVNESFNCFAGDDDEEEEQYPFVCETDIQVLQSQELAKVCSLQVPASTKSSLVGSTPEPITLVVSSPRTTEPLMSSTVILESDPVAIDSRTIILVSAICTVCIITVVAGTVFKISLERRRKRQATYESAPVREPPGDGNIIYPRAESTYNTVVLDNPDSHAYSALEDNYNVCISNDANIDSHVYSQPEPKNAKNDAHLYTPLENQYMQYKSGDTNSHEYTSLEKPYMTLAVGDAKGANELYTPLRRHGEVGTIDDVNCGNKVYTELNYHSNDNHVYMPLKSGGEESGSKTVHKDTDVYTQLNLEEPHRDDNEGHIYTSLEKP